MTLREQARSNHGVAATCLLAAFGDEGRETESETARALTGALLLAEGLHDLGLIRRALTTTSDKR